jgi:hypothetical protein
MPEHETMTVASLANRISDTEELKTIATEVGESNVTALKRRGKDATAIMDPNDNAESAAETEISSEEDSEDDDSSIHSSYDPKAKTSSAHIEVKAPSKAQQKAPPKPPAKSSTKAPKRAPPKAKGEQTNADDLTHDTKRRRISKPTENVTAHTPSLQAKSASEQHKPSTPKKGQGHASVVRETFLLPSQIPSMRRNDACKQNTHQSSN